MEGIIRAAVSEVIRPADLMQLVAEQTLDLIAGADGVLIGLADDQGVSYLWGAGPVGSFIGTRVDLDTSLTGLAIRTRTLQQSEDTTSDPRVDRETCQRLSVASNVCIPLSRGHEIVGVLAASSSRARAFNDDDFAVLRRLGTLVSVAIGLVLDLSWVTTQLLELTSASQEVFDRGGE